MSTAVIDDMIQLAVERRAQDQAAQRQRAQNEQQAHRDAAIAAMRGVIERDLPAVLRDALQVQYEVPHAFDQYASATGTIGEYTIRINALTSGYRITMPYGLEDRVARSDTLQEAVLLAMADVRHLADRRRHERAHEERARVEQQRTQDAAAAEHEQCVVRIAEAKAEARRTLWQWPHKRELTVYRWTWCTAPASADGVADYDNAWSTQDRLDRDGYVHTMDGTRYRLLPDAHLPVVEALTFRSVADLPYGLRSIEQTGVAGIADVSSYREPVRYAEQDDGVVYVDVGAVPVPWVRDLIDRM